MKVLIACEFSAVVRRAFEARGHDAWSCDLIECDVRGKRSKHISTDVLSILDWKWDLMIAHPPCTYLCVSGNRWNKMPGRSALRDAAVGFVKRLAEAPIERIAIENPVGRLSTLWRRPDQIIQPWQFGHGEVKATCLWLKNLPKLVPTNVVEGREAKVHGATPGPDRWKFRSRTYEGIARAMADQWG